MIASPPKINYEAAVYGNEAIDFHTRKIPEAGSNYNFWSVILIDSVLKKNENPYPHTFSRECKSTEKEKKAD